MVRLVGSITAISIFTSALAFVACGGSDVSVSGSSDAGNADGATEGGATAYTLDNVCDLTAARVCGVRKNCCEEAFGYDEAACITREKETCGKDVAQVRAGTMTFDPTSIDSCFTKLAPIIDKCILTVADFTPVAAVLKDCHVFAGSLGEGIACERDNQCKPSSTADAFVSCNEREKKCRTVQLLPAGSSCELREGFSGICSDGLYCDLPLSGPAPRVGTCKTALALGAECKLEQPLECGLGNYCDTTKHCVVGKPGGASCTNNLECATLDCQKTGDAGSGTCRAQDAIVEKAECGK